MTSVGRRAQKEEDEQLLNIPGSSLYFSPLTITHTITLTLTLLKYPYPNPNSSRKTKTLS